MSSHFSFDPQGNRGGRRRLAYATVLVLVILAMDMLSGGAIRSLVQRSFSAVWTASATARAAVVDSGFFAMRSSLAKENRSLREQLDVSTQKAAGYESLRQENEILRSLLRLSEGSAGITAPIISSVRSSPYGTFLVRAGAADGVVVGSLVVSQGGFVIGVVSDVSESVAMVREVFAGGGEIDAHIGGAIVVAQGRGGGNAVAEVPRGIEVREGDAVTAPQFASRPIGIVGRVEADSASAAQTVYVNQPVNLVSLKYVYIVPVQ